MGLSGTSRGRLIQRVPSICLSGHDLLDAAASWHGYCSGDACHEARTLRFDARWEVWIVATVSPESAQPRAEHGSQASKVIRERAEALSRSPTLDRGPVDIACAVGARRQDAYVEHGQRRRDPQGRGASGVRRRMDVRRGHATDCRGHPAAGRQHVRGRALLRLRRLMEVALGDRPMVLERCPSRAGRTRKEVVAVRPWHPHRDHDRDVAAHERRRGGGAGDSGAAAWCALYLAWRACASPRATEPRSLSGLSRAEAGHTHHKKRM